MQVDALEEGRPTPCRQDVGRWLDVARWVTPDGELGMPLRTLQTQTETHPAIFMSRGGFMNKFRQAFAKTCCFSRFELCLWLGSLAVILLSHLLSRNSEWLYLFTSLLGATAVIFVSKGNVTGQILTVIFSLLYGFISYTYRYYGEMITYLGMTLPIAVASVVVWFRHPFHGRHSEVQVNRLPPWEYLLIGVSGTAVSVLFWFVLGWLDTANLFVSTVSVFTSFAAMVLSMRRSPFYALAYAANDLVLIVLWILASRENPSYVGMVICFGAFLVNDCYGFANWMRMERRQRTA